MDTWTRQMGLPLITIKKINDTEYELSQERFLADPSTTSEYKLISFNCFYIHLYIDTIKVNIHY